MLKIEDLNDTQANVNGKWIPARPENYKYRSLRKKISDAIAVFNGKAEAVVWPKN